MRPLLWDNNYNTNGNVTFNDMESLYNFRDGRAGGGLNPPPKSSKKLNNEICISELQDLRTFVGRIPSDPRPYRLAPPIKNMLRHP